MKSLRLRPFVVGILLVAAGVVLIFLSIRPRERVLTIAPGVHLVRPAKGSTWELLVDSSGGAGQAPQGGAEAQDVTGYGLLTDGRVVVEGSVDGAVSLLIIGPAGSEGAGAGATILALFPARASLEDYLRRQSQTPPLMRPPSASKAHAGPFWGGASCITVGLGAVGLGILRRSGNRRESAP